MVLSRQLTFGPSALAGGPTLVGRGAASTLLPHTVSGQPLALTAIAGQDIDSENAGDTFAATARQVVLARQRDAVASADTGALHGSLGDADRQVDTAATAKLVSIAAGDRRRGVAGSVKRQGVTRATDVERRRQDRLGPAGAGAANLKGDASNSGPVSATGGSGSSAPLSSLPHINRVTRGSAEPGAPSVAAAMRDEIHQARAGVMDARVKVRPCGANAFAVSVRAAVYSRRHWHVGFVLSTTTRTPTRNRRSWRK